ncbi:protein S100-A10a isoform X1 [Festucalex cinctus]
MGGALKRMTSCEMEITHERERRGRTGSDEWMEKENGVRLQPEQANMPSELETAMESLILVFHRYASRDGRTGTLNRRELRLLMENELSNFLRCQKDPAAVDKIMKDLDTNGDGQVDFEEFVSLVVGLSIACERCYQLRVKNEGRK